MTTTDRPATRPGRLTDEARANLATIVVESDKQTGRPTPQWIRDLISPRPKAS